MVIVACSIVHSSWAHMNNDGDDNGVTQDDGRTPAKRLTDRFIASLFDIGHL